MEARRIDPLLLPFVQATATEQSQDLLERVLCGTADPIIEKILAHKSRVLPPYQRRDLEDMRAEARLRLVSRLRALQKAPHTNPIDKFCSYVAVTTCSVFYDYLRRQHPAWWRLKNQIHYLLSIHRDTFALWEDDQQMWRCGTAAWRGQPMHAAANARLQQVRDDPAAFRQDLLRHQATPPRPTCSLLSAIFEWVRGPIELDRLITTAAALLGVTDDPRRFDAHDDGLGEPDTMSDAANEVEQRQNLSAAWAEIRGLPRRQRVALLLSLSEIHVFPVEGIVSIRQVARELDIPDEELAELWNRLPLEDMEIARYLGLTRQQVINLRKAAHDRLGRRMRKSRGHHA
ncbi:MAG: hypothetical protein A3H96_22005 [Acidobacteria bacterium RIFCSPLOWO2_02_FULL_67_36]|nr:MAG: hypothetical protein A3H96_22005 [Acidobacteria bacterium RIFCSPLOWO2_02_FULL_67_36]OFW19868.1 MAG: hypothetical protein A3G21_09600 [Acidobacteria bacterium RIFCSPLOWO2_12_FULL_66_21]